MEVFGYHPDLKKWTEIGNSGIFRPEMLAPMGLPPNVRVIAWGLSFRAAATMITSHQAREGDRQHDDAGERRAGGHKAELAKTEAAPICVFPYGGRRRRRADGGGGAERRERLIFAT